MTEARLSLTHPIVFLLDRSNKQVRVPEYVAGAATASNDSCISVNTQADVDGEVTMRLGKSIPADRKTGCQVIHRGIVYTPGGKLAVVTSEYDTILDIEVQNDHATVEISVDNPQGAAVIVIEVQ